MSVGSVRPAVTRRRLSGGDLRINDRPDIENAATEYRIVTPGYLESLASPFATGAR